MEVAGHVTIFNQESALFLGNIVKPCQNKFIYDIGPVQCDQIGRFMALWATF